MLARWMHRLRWAHLVPLAAALVAWTRVAGPRKRFADVLSAGAPADSPSGAERRRPGAGTVAAAVRWATTPPGLRSTCLVRSIALARLLRRYGYPAQVVIGLDERGRHAADRFAHAWVECAPGGGAPGYTEMIRLEV